MKRIIGIIALLLMLTALIGCSSEKSSKQDSENDLSIVREFIATDSLNDGSYMLIKQNGYGVISEWVCYDENDEVTARIECEYDGIFMKKQVSYDAEGNEYQRVVYERHPDGKLISREIYSFDELVVTQYFKDENEASSGTDNDVTIVRYDDLGRAVMWKAILDDGSEESIETEYDKYGLKSEATYLDGEVQYKLELKLK